MTIVMIEQMQPATIPIRLLEVPMISNRRPSQSLWLSLFFVVISACASRPEIPEPTIQVPQDRQLVNVDQIIAPSQKAWQWDANRWFTAELDYQCRGPIRFLDEKNGIDTYVGNDNVPRVIFASDDPDVVLGILASDGYDNQLVFSTDGGRKFVREVRGLPTGQITTFIIVRGGQVYIGMELLGRDPDGYFEWRSPKYRSPWMTSEEVKNHKLVIVAAPLDKIHSRIGWYSILAPKDYRFHSQEASEAGEFIVRVPDIEALGLPHVGKFPPSDACERSIKLPPWSPMMGKEKLINFYDWYASMKAAYPGWANAKTDALIEEDRNWHRGVLIPGATTPTRGHH